MKCLIDNVLPDYLVFRSPFDRFYLNEDYSALAEELFRGDNSWVSVRLRKGEAALEDLYLDGEEIYDRIDRERERGN